MRTIQLSKIGELNPCKGSILQAVILLAAQRVASRLGGAFRFSICDADSLAAGASCMVIAAPHV